MKVMVTLVLTFLSTLAMGFGPGGGWQPGGGGNQPDKPGGGGSGGGSSNSFTYDTFLTESTISGGCIVYGNLMTGYAEDQSVITIPASVTTIADGALAGNANVTTIDATAATALVDVPDSFASGCDALVNATLPSNVTTIGASAFAMDSSLANFTGEGVTAIENYAFFGCTSLVLSASTTYETTGEAALQGVSYSTTNGYVYVAEVAPLVTWLEDNGTVISMLSSKPLDYNTATIRTWLTNDVDNLTKYLYADEFATNTNFKALKVSGTNFLFTAQDIATLSVAHAALQVSTDLVNWKTVSESDIVDGAYAMSSSTNGFARIVYSLKW